jgi:hypothetical protein
MPSQEIINLVGAAAFSLIGWVARELWTAVKDLRKDIHKIEVALPRDYVRRDDLAEIKEMIQKIWGKLEEKADKP